MRFDSSQLVSQLTALDREGGDIRISCGGATVKAHSLILSLRSKYFATALTTGVGNAKFKSEIEVIDCSPEVLTCAVDFMYGIPIPEDFADIEGLLHQADLFMMEDLKSAAGLLIAKTLSLDTLKELVILGERYREVKLQESCGDFILAHIEELKDEKLSELALPPITRQAIHAVKAMKKECKEKIEKIQGDAEENIEKIQGNAEEKIEKIESDAEEKILDAEKKVAEAESKCEREIRDVREKDKKLRTHIEDIGAKVLGTFKTDQFKKRTDWERGAMGQDDYKAYVRGHIYADMLVRCCERFYDGTNIHDAIKVGDIGRVISVDLTGVQVKWYTGRIMNAKRDCFANLELLTHPLKTTFLA